MLGGVKMVLRKLDKTDIRGMNLKVSLISLNEGIGRTIKRYFYITDYDNPEDQSETVHYIEYEPEQDRI